MAISGWGLGNGEDGGGGCVFCPLGGLRGGLFFFGLGYPSCFPRRGGVCVRWLTGVFLGLSAEGCLIIANTLFSSMFVQVRDNNEIQ